MLNILWIIYFIVWIISFVLWITATIKARKNDNSAPLSYFFVMCICVLGMTLMSILKWKLKFL